MYSKYSKKENGLTFKEEIAVLKEVIDLEALVEDLGFKIITNNKGELRASCIIHGGDNKTSFRLNKKSRTWVCFSHKCHEIFGNDIISLVMACKSVDFKAAIEYLKDISGYFSLDKSNFYNLKHRRDKDAFIKEYNENSKEVKSKFMNEVILKQYIHYRSNFFIEEGFSDETLNFFEIAGGYVDKIGSFRDVIPIRDINGKLVGCAFSAINRDIHPDDKYRFTFNFNKDSILYNLNNAVELLREKPLIIVEGFKSVWRLYQLGIKNVVGAMGSQITPGQMNLIYAHARKGVVIFFDNDVAGVGGAFAAEELMSTKIKVLGVVCITEVDENGKGLDPADLPDKVIYNYLNGWF